VNEADRDLIANATAVAEIIDATHGFGAGIIRQLARRHRGAHRERFHLAGE
jgi:hypothetical protein